MNLCPPRTEGLGNTPCFLSAGLLATSHSSSASLCLPLSLRKGPEEACTSHPPRSSPTPTARPGGGVLPIGWVQPRPAAAPLWTAVLPTHTLGPLHSHTHPDLPTHMHPDLPTHTPGPPHRHTRTSPLPHTQTSQLTHRDLPTHTHWDLPTHTLGSPHSHTESPPPHFPSVPAAGLCQAQSLPCTLSRPIGVSRTDAHHSVSLMASLRRPPAGLSEAPDVTAVPAS